LDEVNFLQAASFDAEFRKYLPGQSKLLEGGCCRLLTRAFSEERFQPCRTTRSSRMVCLLESSLDASTAR